MKGFIEVYDEQFRRQGLFKEKLLLSIKTLIPINQIKAVFRDYDTGKAIIYCDLGGFSIYNSYSTIELYEDVLAKIEESL